MASESLTHYKEFLIILGIAGLIVPLFLRLGINAVLAYLLVGIALSPSAMTVITSALPVLRGLAITDTASMAPVAELGVVFLMFLIGIELSFERLMTMRRLVVGFGSLQILITMAIVATAAWSLGLPLPAAVTLGAALSLSSTAIVIQLLSDTKRLTSQTGRASFAVLLAQDLAVIPLLLLVGILGTKAAGPLWSVLLQALAQAALAIALIVLVGRFALRPLLRLVARLKSPDHFMAMVLLIAVGTGVAATLAGLSMALGAFVSGLMLAETEYRRAIESIIEPFKGLLLGTFFLLVGMSIDLTGLFQAPVFIIAATLILIAAKAAVIFGLARLFKLGRGTALQTALLLGPCGEFAFVILGQAVATGLLPDTGFRQSLLIVTLSMVAIAPLARLGRLAAVRLARNMPLPVEAAALPPADTKAKVIIAGYGRVGRLIAEMLAEHKISCIAVDIDADNVARARNAGESVYFGDAANPAFLRACGLADAVAIAVTMDNPNRVEEVTRVARAERSDLKIVARARDERQAIKLYALGVTEAVPETIEASLQLGEALLVETGIAMGFAIASVHERREGFRKLLGRPNRRETLSPATARGRRRPL